MTCKISALTQCCVIIISSIICIGIIPALGFPIILDQELTIEEYVSGLQLPTSMEFIENDILVLQKNDGKILLIRDEIIQPEPVLDVNVSFIGERGLLGITSINSTVYMYFTESEQDGGEPLGNRIYKYDWDGKVLKNPTLITTLPADKSSLHNGGVLIDNGYEIFTVIGDQLREGLPQNQGSGEFDDTSVIIKFNVDKSVLQPSKTANPSEYYYAIGIRNSFGLALDPITGNLWDTENAEDKFDEINLVRPKFNSGWKKIVGFATESQKNELPKIDGFSYSDPEFTWEKPTAPTAITFIDSPLFEKYNQSVFVASFNFGTIYEFKLNSDRTGFVFDSAELQDKIANSDDSQDEIIFGSSFGGISDMKFGPDGMLYVLSLTEGKIYRISPSGEAGMQTQFTTPDCSAPPQPQINWSGCNLAGADLQNTDLRFANLTNTILSESNLQNADLSNANLQYAVLKNVNLQNAKLLNANLENTNLSHSNLNHADLTGSQMSNANLEESSLLQTNLSHTNLVDTSFRNAYLNQTDFIRSNAEKADFAGATFHKTNIPSCFGSNFIFKGLRFVMTQAHNTDFFLLDPIEWLMPRLCPPHYYIEPVP